MAAGEIKQVKLGSSDIYELLPKYIQDNEGKGKTWQDILDLTNIGLKIVIDEPNTEGTAPKTTASADTMSKLYLVHFETTTSGTYTEFVTIRSGSEGAYTYAWEKIGTTDVDLSTYAKKGTYTSASESATHKHTVTVPTVSKVEKKLAASASGTAVAVDGTAAAITGFGTHPTDKVLGENTGFTVTGGSATMTNVKATASGTTVGVDGTAEAITALGTPTTAKAITALGTPTTAKAITALGTPTTAKAVTGYTPTTDKVLGEGTQFTVTGDGLGDVTKVNLKATASGTALSTSGENFVQSYSGVTSKLDIGTVNGVKDTTGVSVVQSVNTGTAASFTPSVVGGVLDLSSDAFTTNTPTTIKDTIYVAQPATTASNVVVGLSASGTGATVMTGLGTPTTKSALVSASVSTQPTVTLSTVATAETGTTALVSEVAAGTITVEADSTDRVTAVTGLGTPATADAITGFGTHTTADAITGFGTHTTADAITGFGTHTTETVATGVKVTAQPTVALATGAAAGTGVVSLANGVTEIGVTADSTDRVDALTGLGTATTADVATGVKVTAQPTITLDGAASTGVEYVSSVTVGSEVATSSANDASHTHTVTI